MSFNYTMMTYTIARQQGNKPDMKEICQLAREIGMTTMDQVTLYGYEPSEIRCIAADYGISIVCYTFFVDLNFPDAASRRLELEKFRQELENAHQLGASKIMLPFGGKSEYTREQSRQNVIEGLKEAVNLGQASGIQVTVEHVPCADAPFIVSSDINEAIQEVPGLLVTYDPGNAFTGGEDPQVTFMKNKDFIVHAHFKDWVCVDQGNFRLTGLDGRKYLPTYIGKGLLDYPKVLRTMKEHGYSQTINIEYEGDDFPAVDVIRKAVEYLRKIEESL
jgi:sugar phosphate isomerase/epimerase